MNEFPLSLSLSLSRKGSSMRPPRFFAALSVSSKFGVRIYGSNDTPWSWLAVYVCKAFKTSCLGFCSTSRYTKGSPHWMRWGGGNLMVWIELGEWTKTFGGPSSSVSVAPCDAKFGGTSKLCEAEQFGGTCGFSSAYHEFQNTHRGSVLDQELCNQD